jgi:hypothetical protein
LLLLRKPEFTVAVLAAVAELIALVCICFVLLVESISMLIVVG